MKYLFLILVGMVFTGCATSSMEKWQKITPGQTKDEVVGNLGNPNAFVKEGDRDIMIWNMDAYSQCAVRFSSEAKVDAKNCREDSNSRSRDNLARMQAFQEMQNKNTTTNQPYRMPTYQPPRPTDTSCSSRMVAGSMQTNCTSTQTGIDTSMYH